MPTRRRGEDASRSHVATDTYLTPVYIYIFGYVRAVRHRRAAVYILIYERAESSTNLPPLPGRHGYEKSRTRRLTRLLDDKARVPTGMTVAHKQSPTILYMKYRIRLPDHDWVIAERHKLMLSVYGAMRIDKGGIGTNDVWHRCVFHCLPHDTFGSRLNAIGKTTNSDLELKTLLRQGFPLPYPLRSEPSLIFPSSENVIASDYFSSLRGKEVLCRIGADVKWVDIENVTILNNQLEPTPIIRDVPEADPLSEWAVSPWTENLI
ncbi:hypothetical protein EVAR_62015_1 [Eumeta japonica]|uniref:Uncharacterized protein n=1 Tax=Eumeta variegata TaxID=151549 RepID=A0A4C2A250_EUMVA|nr:hypothetical protein EVAR_62015_1 [Eumeta japonica]